MGSGVAIGALALASIGCVGCGGSGGSSSSGGGGSTQVPSGQSTSSAAGLATTGGVPASTGSSGQATSPPGTGTSGGGGVNAGSTAAGGGAGGSLETFGSAASRSQRSQTAAVVKTYGAALLGGDGARVCGLLTAQAKQLVQRRIAAGVAREAAGCAAYFSEHGGRSAANVAQFAGLEVTDVRVQGDLAIVFVRSRGTPKGFLTVRHEGSAWKIEQWEVTTLLSPG